MAKPISQWDGVREFQESLTRLAATLAASSDADVIASRMADTQAFIDWFQIHNEVELCSERIEAEFANLEEQFDAEPVTARTFGPVSDGTVELRVTHDNLVAVMKG